MMGTGNRMTVGFVGIGSMGLPMAINLLRGGYSVKGYSRVPERNERFGEAGGTVCSSVEEVLSDVDVVITMVPNGSVVNDIVTRYKHRITPSTLFIDMSTTSPADARAAAEQLAEVGVDFLDAPVSGGLAGASEGTLSIMVGGHESVLEKARGGLALLGRSITYMGPVGSGQVTKAANQLIVGGTLALVAEATVLLKKNGVDPATALSALRGGLAGSRILDLKGPQMIEREFTPTFAAGLHLKDMDIAMAVGHEAHCALPVTACVLQLFEAVCACGFAEQDHSAIIKIIETLSGIEVERRN